MTKPAKAGSIQLWVPSVEQIASLSPLKMSALNPLTTCEWLLPIHLCKSVMSSFLDSVLHLAFMLLAHIDHDLLDGFTFKAFCTSDRLNYFENYSSSQNSYGNGSVRELEFMLAFKFILDIFDSINDTSFDELLSLLRPLRD